MRRTGDITRSWVFFQAKHISQRKEYSSNWHCSEDSFKNQTCREDCTRDRSDTGKRERGGGRFRAPLKWEILAILKSLGTLPPTVREPGFTPTRWSMGLLKQNEVSRSPPQSSCKSRPEGMAVGYHMQNLGTSAGKWSACFYRKLNFTSVLPKSRLLQLQEQLFFLLQKYQILRNLITQPPKQLNTTLCYYSVRSFQKQMPVLQINMLNKWFETLLSVEHTALFFSDLTPSAIHVIVGGKERKKEEKKKGGRQGKREREINSCRQTITLLQIPT